MSDSASNESYITPIRITLAMIGEDLHTTEGMSEGRLSRASLSKAEPSILVCVVSGWDQSDVVPVSPSSIPFEGISRYWIGVIADTTLICGRARGIRPSTDYLSEAGLTTI